MAYIMQVVACDDNIKENYKEIELYDSNFLNTEKKLVLNHGDTVDNVVTYINSNAGDRFHISVNLLNNIALKQTNLLNEIYYVERNLAKILANNKFMLGNNNIELTSPTESSIYNAPTYTINSIINYEMFEKIVKSEKSLWERIARIEKYCLSYFNENEYAILGITDSNDFIKQNIGEIYFENDINDLLLTTQGLDENFDIVLNEYCFNFTFDSISNVKYDTKYNSDLKFLDFVNAFNDNVEDKYKLSKTKAQNY